MEHGFVLLRRQMQRTPAMIPIADDPGGNLFVINVDKTGDFGKIYFWDHNNESDGEPQPYYGNVHFIANSFCEFIGQLH